jgi:hypothetical protein
MVPEFRSYSAKKKEFRSYISKAPLGSATQTGELSYRVGSAATSTATASRQKGKRRPNIPRLGSAGRLACRPPGQCPSRAARRYFPFPPGRGARAEGQKPQIGLAGDTTLSYTTTDEEHVHDMSNDLTLLCEWYTHDMHLDTTTLPRWSNRTKILAPISSNARSCPRYVIVRLTVPSKGLKPVSMRTLWFRLVLHLQLKVISIFGSRLSGTVQVTKITTGASYLTDYACVFIHG